MTRDTALDSHILSIIQTQEIPEQSYLQDILKGRGHDIPQATLSRRLKKLKIAKVAGIYKVIDLNTPTLPIILNIQISEFGMIVLHTHPGNAHSLAYFFDQKHVNLTAVEQKNSGILGTLAGDDTVLLIIRSKAEFPHVLNTLQKEFPYLEKSLK